MKIDVIIPTYNRAPVLKRAIRSVLNQTYPHFHLYVVDDGSSDNTDLVMQEFSAHPQVSLLTQANQGVSRARNMGVEKSRNDWISFLDSDDEWLPKKLEQQVQFLRAHPHIRFLHAEEIWMRNGIRVNPKARHSKSAPELFKRSLELCLISPSTVIMKRDLFKEFQGFDETFTVCEDYDLWLKIMLREDIGFLPDYVARKYGGHPDQLSTQFPAMDYWRIKSLIALLPRTNNPETRFEIEAQIALKAPVLLAGFLKHGQEDRHAELVSLLEVSKINIQ